MPPTGSSPDIFAFWYVGLIRAPFSSGLGRATWPALDAQQSTQHCMPSTQEITYQCQRVGPLNS
ncbi:unnamed protein product [Malus baccata var. baccata]